MIVEYEDFFTLETSKNKRNRTFLRNWRIRVKNPFHIVDIRLKLTEGSLYPKSFVTLPVQAPGCKTAWKIRKVFNDFEDDEQPRVDWDRIGQLHLNLQFDFDKFYFNDESEGILIFPNSKERCLFLITRISVRQKLTFFILTSFLLIMRK